MEQQTSYPIKNIISDELANYFSNANAGTYQRKQYFYDELKKPFLEKYAKFAGYDLQTITRKCFTCNGTGIYKTYFWQDGQQYVLSSKECYNCNNGIYSITDFTLERYILNDKIYHFPTFGKRSNVVFVNHFTEKLPHEPIDFSQAIIGFLNIAYQISYQKFIDELVHGIKHCDFLKYPEIVEAVQIIIREENDNLPF